ncbi:MAG: hypothetical protein ACOVSW_19575 [Candidatus Kapaibacteriota bacterium]|jgi:hypothetical protein
MNNSSLPEYSLDDEEQDILDSYERGEWTETGKTTLAELQQAASLKPLMAKELYLALPSEDAHRLQARAEKRGVSIQELVTAIIHASLDHEEVQ